MQKNIGHLDTRLRLAAGSVILILGIVFGSWWGIIGLVPILTALVGVCPLYFLLGINTCSRDISMPRTGQSSATSPDNSWEA